MTEATAEDATMNALLDDVVPVQSPTAAWWRLDDADVWNACAVNEDVYGGDRTFYLSDDEDDAKRMDPPKEPWYYLSDDDEKDFEITPLEVRLCSLLCRGPGEGGTGTGGEGYTPHIF